MDKLFKNLLFVFILLIVDINSFAAVVSDNDGSAFITKAEFDSLKNNFQSQIDGFNASVDSKIDSAIASYLSGIKITTVTAGKNFIENINYKRPVRFYNYSSNNIKASSIANLRVKYLWRMFGTFGIYSMMNPDPLSANGYPRKKYVEGSWLVDLFAGNHTRGFVMNAGGNTTNYQYQTTKHTYSGETFYALDEPQTKTFECTVGAYYYSEINNQMWTTIPTTIEYKTRQIEIPFTTNTIEPGNITYELPIATVTANGASWNIWKKIDNPIDCDFLYDFTNTTYNANQSILAYSFDDFNNWTDQAYIQHSKPGIDADYWVAYYGDGEETGNRRSWCFINQPHTNDSNMTGSVEWAYNRMYYYRPHIDTITADKLINGDASSEINKPVKSYHGVPFTTKLDGNVKKMSANINVKIYDGTNTLVTNAPYYVLIRNKPFDNVNSSTYVSGSDSTIKKFNSTTGSTGSADFSFELDETYLNTMSGGDVMYMRIVPSTAGYYADVNCSNIMFTIE